MNLQEVNAYETLVCNQTNAMSAELKRLKENGATDNELGEMLIVTSIWSIPLGLTGLLQILLRIEEQNAKMIALLERVADRKK